MEGYPHHYQPPLLSLQDMLNLSEDEDQEDTWSSNPYSISNFFEPIVSLVKQDSPQKQETLQEQHETKHAVPGQSSFDSRSSASPFQNEASSCNYRLSPKKGSPLKKFETKPQTYTPDNHGNADDFLESFVFDVNRSQSKKFEVREENDIRKIAADALINLKQERVYSEDLSASDDFNSFQKTPMPVDSSVLGVHIKKENTTTNKTLSARAIREAKRKNAIAKLEKLITCLKTYSNLLGAFLTNEGELILEHYEAQSMLSGLLPEMEESETGAALSDIDPFELAHSLTRAVVDTVQGKTVLSSLPALKGAYLWRTSELLLLQKAVLESVIIRREFLLNCRYTDLLTEMGFDDDDLENLRRNSVTKEMELGTLKILLNDHEFYCKLNYSKKKPIQTNILRKNASGQLILLALPSPQQLVEDRWKALVKIRTKTSLSNIKTEDIDWLFVMKKLSMKTPTMRVTETTCKLTYDLLLSTKFNNSVWHVDELRKLRDIREKYKGVSWANVAYRLGTNRSPFLCFVKYKQYCVEDSSSNLEVSPSTLRWIVAWQKECRGNVVKLENMLITKFPKEYKPIKPKGLISLFHTKLNPRLRKGHFTVAEDALLFATVEKYRVNMLGKNRVFDPVAYALPWRLGCHWQMRFKRLLTNFYYQTWTMEEDSHLWNLVNEYGPNYKIIQRSFPSKNRKQCRSRYLYLVKKFKLLSLEEYHVIYNGTRNRDRIHIGRLNKIAMYLNLTIKSQQRGSIKFISEADLQFFKRRRPPRESELESYILTVPTFVLVQTLNRLAEFLICINGKWAEIAAKNESLAQNSNEVARSMLGFDRRKFDPSCPASMASALHIRRATLLQQELFPDLTPFEENVYNYYKYFSLKGSAKINANRVSIPTLDALRKFTKISRLIEDTAPKKAISEGLEEVIFSIKPEDSPEEKAKEEAKVLEELETKRLGKRAKGSKTKKQIKREQTKLAAKIRWGKNKLESENDDCCSYVSGVSSSNSIEDASPGTPSSVVSVDSCGTNENSTSGINHLLKRDIVSTISDHAYTFPMESPSVFSLLSMSQLQTANMQQHERFKQYLDDKKTQFYSQELD